MEYILPEYMVDSFDFVSKTKTIMKREFFTRVLSILTTSGSRAHFFIVFWYEFLKNGWKSPQKTTYWTEAGFFRISKKWYSTLSNNRGDRIRTCGFLLPKIHFAEDDTNQNRLAQYDRTSRRIHTKCSHATGVCCLNMCCLNYYRIHVWHSYVNS